MNTVTASELQKNFGKYQAQARREPIKVTSHGRDSVVLISVEDYERYKSIDDRVSMSIVDLPKDIIAELNQTLDGMKEIKAADLKQHGPW